MILFYQAGQCQDGQQYTFKAKFASAAVEPFLQGMGPSAGSSPADGDGFAAQGKRDVGVGGCPLYLRDIAQVSIYRTDYMQNPGICVQLPGWTVPNGHNLRTQPAGVSL